MWYFVEGKFVGGCNEAEEDCLQNTFDIVRAVSRLTM